MGTRRLDGTLTFGGNPRYQNPPTGFRYMDGYFRYPAFESDNPNFDWRTFNFEQHGTRVETQANIYSPTDPNLSKLQQRGGKLIPYHGWADPALSAYTTLNYYDKVVAAMGGRQKTTVPSAVRWMRSAGKAGSIAILPITYFKTVVCIRDAEKQAANLRISSGDPSLIMRRISHIFSA